MQRKLIPVWLLSLFSIPLLSVYGRPLQLYVLNDYSMGTLVVYLGLMLVGVAAVYGVVLLRAGVNSHMYHLIWVAVLAVLFYTSLPSIEKIHVATFGLFGFLSQKLFEQKIAALVCVAISGMDELLQHFLVARVGDWRDVWLNLFSTALGMFLAFLLIESRQKHLDEDSP